MPTPCVLPTRYNTGPIGACNSKKAGPDRTPAPPYCLEGSIVLDGLSFWRLLLILAPGDYREGERRYPDRDEEDIGDGGEAGREPDGREKRVRVDDEDETADGRAHDSSR